MNNLEMLVFYNEYDLGKKAECPEDTSEAQGEQTLHTHTGRALDPWGVRTMCSQLLFPLLSAHKLIIVKRIFSTTDRKIYF